MWDSIQRYLSVFLTGAVASYTRVQRWVVVLGMLTALLTVDGVGRAEWVREGVTVSGRIREI